MENVKGNGFEWNLYENLKEFKLGRQKIYKTASNIRALHKLWHDGEKEDRRLTQIAAREMARELPENE